MNKQHMIVIHMMLIHTLSLLWTHAMTMTILGLTLQKHDIRSLSTSIMTACINPLITIFHRQARSSLGDTLWIRAFLPLTCEGIICVYEMDDFQCIVIINNTHDQTHSHKLLQTWLPVCRHIAADAILCRVQPHTKAQNRLCGAGRTKQKNNTVGMQLQFVFEISRKLVTRNWIVRSSFGSDGAQNWIVRSSFMSRDTKLDRTIQFWNNWGTKLDRTIQFRVTSFGCFQIAI